MMTINIGHQVHTWYLSRTHGRCPWRKNLSCGEISNFCTWQMWRNLNFLNMWINFTWQMWRNLKSPSLCVQFMVFCCILCCFVAKSLFFAIYAGFRKIGLLQFPRYCVEKILAKNSDRGEKNDKYQVWQLLSIKENICADCHRKSYVLQDAKYFLAVTWQLNRTHCTLIGLSGTTNNQSLHNITEQS